MRTVFKSISNFITKRPFDEGRYIRWYWLCHPIRRIKSVKVTIQSDDIIIIGKKRFDNLSIVPCIYDSSNIYDQNTGKNLLSYGNLLNCDYYPHITFIRRELFKNVQCGDQMMSTLGVVKKV